MCFFFFGVSLFETTTKKASSFLLKDGYNYLHVEFQNLNREREKMGFAFSNECQFISIVLLLCCNMFCTI